MKNETEKNWIRYVVNLCSKPTFALGGSIFFQMTCNFKYNLQWHSVMGLGGRTITFQKLVQNESP